MDMKKEPRPRREYQKPTLERLGTVETALATIYIFN
jgi:hypothetical protein